MKYYSEKLNKLFETEKELTAAENAALEEEQKKADAAKAKKAEAKVVEDAFKARNAARRDYNTKVVEARKAYNLAIVEAKKIFEDAVAEAVKEKDAAENNYNEALKVFTEKHPEGYHMTLKDGDNVMTISNSSDRHYENMNKEINSIFDSLLNIWKL